MNSFQITQTLATHTRFTVFEACGESFQFPVVLKRCEYRETHEAEFFIRSVLIKTKAKAYSQPLLSIFADVDEDKSFIVFVWKKGEALDIEVERDEESQFPPGKAGYGKSKVLYKDLLTKGAVKRALCLTLGKKVVLKVSKHVNMLEMNSVFREALVQARCTHPSVCELLDFRLYVGKSGHQTSYIVMESFKRNLVMELQVRKFRPYDEVELMTILQEVIAVLLNAKRQDVAHQDIRPYNILRGPQGLKLTAFGAICLERLCPKTFSTEMYMSPEACEAMVNTKMQQRSFESDVFSLGMTMLHLAATELPERTPVMSRSELQALLQRKVQALGYSEELKRLLAAMLSTAPSDRPPLEVLQSDAERVYRQATQTLAQEALGLAQQARLNINEGEKAKAVELAAAAHAIYSRLPKNKVTAVNLNNWGDALRITGRSAKAMKKYAAASAICSQFPEDKDTANLLKESGDALCNEGRCEEAVGKYIAANTIYSRLPEDRETARFLKKWGDTLGNIGKKKKAMKKYAAAYAIYSRLPEDKDTARFLQEWGKGLSWIERREEAVEKFAAANAIYSRFPEDKDTVSFLKEWSDILKHMGRSEEAMEKYAAAYAVNSRFPEDIHTAIFLNKWGDELRLIGRSEEAMEKYAAAHAVYSRLPEDRATAMGLIHLGNTLDNMGRNAEAMESYAAATAIYSRLPVDKDTALFLKEWCDVLIKMGRTEEAVKNYEKFRAFFVLGGRDYDVRKCDAAIDNLK